jgi:prepilin-type N-terminal cleavage/methylation domain-containing protein
MGRSAGGKRNAGFTLIEIMIVVFVIGILLGIAVPNFTKAKQSSATHACVANLMQIWNAKQQWAMDNRKAESDTPTAEDLYGAGNYIIKAPSCPSNGAYTIGPVNAAPTCSFGGAHAAP